MRRIVPAEGEYYHVFNRGVEKRDIFLDSYDFGRFLESTDLFKSEDPIGSIFERKFQKSPRLGSLTPKSGGLIDLICYCLNPNHFHLILYQKKEKGIQKFMQKLGTGYTNYFNEKYKRSGALFQGSYKAVHLASNEQLLHTSVYVNLNNRFGSLTPKLSRSSWEEYQNNTDNRCNKEIILGQFTKPQGYVAFAETTLPQIIERKQQEKETAWLLGS